MDEQMENLNNLAEQQLKELNQHFESIKQQYLTLAEPIRQTEQYKMACEMCKDEILMYPNISGRKSYTNIEVEKTALNYILNQLKEKDKSLEEFYKGSAELLEIVAPFMSDFTGYDEERGGFDIILCVKELIEELGELREETVTLKKQHRADKGLITSLGKTNYKLIQEYDRLKTLVSNIEQICKEGCYDECNMPLDELSVILQKINNA